MRIEVDIRIYFGIHPGLPDQNLRNRNFLARNRKMSENASGQIGKKSERDFQAFRNLS
jgi:hypothetical protein